MERLTTCQNIACHKSFKVSSPGKIADYADLSNVHAMAFVPIVELQIASHGRKAWRSLRTKTSDCESLQRVAQN